ncbi:MAG: T9SS type A sorting domain-containing protein [candidate division Zixibacteria bacterium]|nr:T9SS type A sorting domain-containing protein [candidate division Zixibacteria bacterium]
MVTDNVVVIRYHTGGFSGQDPFYQWNPSEINTRSSFYSPGYTPHFYVDGFIDGEYYPSTWDDLIDDRQPVESPMFLEIIGSYNSGPRQASVDIRLDVVSTPSSDDLRIFYGLTESDIFYNAPNGHDIQNQVFREFLSSASGNSITPESGNAYSYHIDFTVSSQYDANEVEIFAFVQNMDTGEILQGAKADITSLRPRTMPWVSTGNRTPTYPAPSESCLISATILDEGGSITSASLYYDIGGGYTALPMSNISDSFYVTLPGQADGTTVYYYISATDNSVNTTETGTYGLYIGTLAGPIIGNIVRNPEAPIHSEPCEVSAAITDPFLVNSVSSAILYYDDGSGYDDITMENTADSFYATIPGIDEGTTVYYYIEATNNIELSSYSDTLSYFVVPQNCLSCIASTTNPRVPSQNGLITWDLDVTNCGLNTLDVYAEIYPTLGDCAGTQFDFNIRKNIVNNLVPGNSYTGYYYYSPGTVSGVVDAALSINVGFAYEFWLGACCFEFKFTYPWGRTGDQIILEPGIWGEIGDSPIIPEATALRQNYPNPFNAATTISYDLTNDGNVSISIYNLAGQKMETLVQGHMQAGEHNIIWDASSYSSGVYFCKMTVEDKTITTKMNLLK